MKKLIVATAVSLMLTSGQGARSEDKADAPEMEIKLLVNNDKIAVMEVLAKPGDRGVLQERPPRVLYFFTAGQLTYTDFDGKSEVLSVKPGEADWRDRETYEVENTGQTEVRFLLIVPK